MRIDHAPYVSEVQRIFCPVQWIAQTETKYVWVRERASGILKMTSYEVENGNHTVIESPHKVIQSYILRRLPDHVVRAVAIVSSGGGAEVKVNEWNVWMIDADTNFSIQLHNSTLFCQVQDENNISYSVANIGGGNVITRMEYVAWEQHHSKIAELYARQASLRAKLVKMRTARQQAEEQKKQRLQQAPEGWRENDD